MPGLSPRTSPQLRYRKRATIATSAQALACFPVGWRANAQAAPTVSVPGHCCQQRPQTNAAVDCHPSKLAVPAADAATSLARALHDFGRGKMAHYKVPRYYVFADDFPMTVTGKIQKFIMRDQSVDLLHLHNVPPAHS